jgi:hypothetical protein
MVKVAARNASDWNVVSQVCRSLSAVRIEKKPLFSSDHLEENEKILRQ